MEISASGANPAAAATTGLIPTRGPRRAAVVACSSSLVRDLIATCITLRAENVALNERLVQPASPAKSVDVAAAAAEVVGGTGGDKNARNGPQAVVGGGNVVELDHGAEAAKVFGQLLSLNVFGFLGPQALGEGRAVCRSWRDKCTWDCW